MLTLDKIKLEIDERAATTVMMVSGGYPEAYEMGKEISGISQVEDSIVFHAGTTRKEGKVLTSGGRVIALTSYGSDFKKALETSYRNVKHIRFDKQNYRKDLGFDL